MKLNFMPEAEEALFEISTWVENRNTPGSGIRFINKFIASIEEYALPGVSYAICKNKVLASFGLKCIPINDWIVAFKQTKNEFIVHYILYGPGLK
ncbi:MAG: hypothetical protein ABI855_04200 [Bacteroidota bacterium]